MSPLSITASWSLRSFLLACDQMPPCRCLRKSPSEFVGLIEEPWLDGDASDTSSMISKGFETEVGLVCSGTRFEGCSLLTCNSSGLTVICKEFEAAAGLVSSGIRLKVHLLPTCSSNGSMVSILLGAVVEWCNFWGVVKGVTAMMFTYGIH